MNKQEFINVISEKTGETKKHTGEFLDAILSNIAEISKTEDIQFTGYFKTVLKETKKRIGRNPKTGEPVTIPSKKIVKIKCGNKFDITEGEAND